MNGSGEDRVMGNSALSKIPSCASEIFKTLDVPRKGDCAGIRSVEFYCTELGKRRADSDLEPFEGLNKYIYNTRGLSNYAIVGDIAHIVKRLAASATIDAIARN